MFEFFSSALGDTGDVFVKVFKFLIYGSYIWLPLLLLYGLWNMWINYIRSRFMKKLGSVLLEIKLPKDVLKNPSGMEIIFTTFFQSGAMTYHDAFVVGAVKPWFSLELVSFGGEIHFFVWTRPKYRNALEAQMYAQYPGIEIYEVPDYTTDLRHDPAKNFMWGTYFILSKADPYPIKTYVDYGLHEDPKEEFKIDPMTAMIEYLGSLKKGEQAWIQILVSGHGKEGLKDGRLFKRPDWKEQAKKEVDKLMKRDKKPKEGEFPSFAELSLTKNERATVDAIERSVGKYAFNTMIRALYISTNEAFNPVNIPGLIGSVRQYNSQDMNGFRLGWYTDFKDSTKDWFKVFPFLQVMFKNRRPMYEKQMLDAYKRRSFFQIPYKNFHGKPYILTTEELATIFHFPGEVAATPTFSRITSKKGEPPANLPVGNGFGEPKT